LGLIQAGVVARRARKLNPQLRIVARAHSQEEASDLKRWGADVTVLAEDETAAKMAERVAP
jgi:CPA2 family monovalent cation:H+ antiporter-2